MEKTIINLILIFKINIITIIENCIAIIIFILI